MGEWTAAMWWWIGAGVLVAAELATGTFYLLMFALGMAGGALAAHAGASVAWQIVAAALVGGGATAAWHVRRARSPRSAPVQSNRDAHLDIGERVDVTAWNTDRTARVHYRGASWLAVYRGIDALPRPGAFRIAEVDGNRLILVPLENV